MVAKNRTKTKRTKSRNAGGVLIRRATAAKRVTIAPLLYKMGRMGIQRSNPAADMTNAVAEMIRNPCGAKLTAGAFGYNPTSINRFVQTYTIPMNSSPVANPYTSGYVVWFPGYTCNSALDAVPTVGECQGSLFIWASPSSSTAPLNAGGNNLTLSSQFGRGNFAANGTVAPTTTQSISTPDYLFLSGVASSTQLISSCIDVESLGPALSAGGEIFAINGVDPVRFVGGINVPNSPYPAGVGISVDDMAVVYGSDAKAIKPGSCFSTKFFSRSPNASRRLTIGEGVYSITRSTTAVENQTVITPDGEIFTPLGYGFGFRNIPIAAVPGSATAITSGVKDLRFTFTNIKEWNATAPVGLGQRSTLPIGKDVHSAAVDQAASVMRATVGSSFHEMGQAADRIMHNPTVGNIIHEGLRIGTRFADRRYRNN